MTKPIQKVVHGDDLLYRFFKRLLEDSPEIADGVLELLFSSTAIWLPVAVYQRLPILLPMVVRDPMCRGNPKKGVPDAWGSPNEDGFLRDDNSLIKSITRSLTVSAPGSPHLNSAKMGSEFVAAHVWRVVNAPDLASRIPLLNSFVPNLVWLPRQVSKLTDAEGSVMQQFLQRLAWTFFRHVEVQPLLGDVVESAWALIPPPSSQPSGAEMINSFIVTEKFFATRESRIRCVVRALERLSKGDILDEKVVTSRYTTGLPDVAAEKRAELLTFLKPFVIDCSA